MQRITEVDALRGFALLLMIAYHFFFDLWFLGVAEINIWNIEWLLFQRTVGTLFILVAGISMTLSESRNQEGYARHAKRGLKLIVVALLITLATWVYPHEGFIMFGIIHFLAIAAFLGPLFFRFGKWNVLLGLLIIAAGFFINAIRTDLAYFFWLGVVYEGYRPLDHYSLVPWFGLILIGIYLGQRLFPEGKQLLRHYPKYTEKLAFLGKHSLLIYLVHQPVIVGLILLALSLAGG
ncbi:DUF1624 domain-containing protein [Candidatus Micrarchaeota archaeon]|nr:DUF1624 domain-containing protein [Candidatus Micrarchaeota archaeon]